MNAKNACPPKRLQISPFETTKAPPSIFGCETEYIHLEVSTVAWPLSSKKVVSDVGVEVGRRVDTVSRV